MAGERIESTSLRKPVDAKAYRTTTILGPGVTFQTNQTYPAAHMEYSVLATNYLRWTEDYANAVWVKGSNMTVSTTAVQSPDPGRFSQSVVTTAGPRTMYQDTLQTFGIGDTLRVGVWMKALIAATVRLQIDVAAAQAFVDCAVTTDWQYFSVNLSGPSGSNIARYSLIYNTAGTYYTFGPQIAEHDAGFNIYLPSTADYGIYTKAVTVNRFIMADDGTGSMMDDAGTGDQMLDSV